MLHHLPSSTHNDPFHFPSSSPERLTARSHVATRPNPYTVKSQNTQYYTSLRSTAQTIPIDPRLSATTAALKQSPLLPQRSVDSLYSSLEAANRSPRCSSKPQSSPAKQFPLLTMVKPKPRPVKAITLGAELAAAKRLSCVKVASAAAGKRRRNVAEAVKQHTKRSNSSSTTNSTPILPPRSRSPSLSPTPTNSPSSQVPRQQKSPKAIAFQVPRITVRSPTPEPEPPLDSLLHGKSGGETQADDQHKPLYSAALLTGLSADLSKAEDGIDSILSKYFDLRKCARTICIELLRYLASSVCKIYSYVEDPESDLGQAKLRAISSRLFRHTITGFFHLLDDTLAPYATASSLALVSAKVLQDFDTATEWCCRVLEGRNTNRAQQNLRHGELFRNVLNDELDKILDRGLVMTGMHDRLALPGKGPPMFDNVTIESDGDSDWSPASSRSSGSQRIDRAEMRKQWAQKGDERDQFVGMDVVRFIGQLALHEVIGVTVLTRWLDRFLIQTVCIGTPSAWEIECACALLITVGALLDRKPEATEPASCAAETTQDALGPKSSSSNSSDTTCVEFQIQDHAGWALLHKAMDRVQFLVTEAEISPSAREWLVEVQQLRERGWRRDADLDSLNESSECD